MNLKITIQRIVTAPLFKIINVDFKLGNVPHATKQEIQLNLKRIAFDHRSSKFVKFAGK